MKKLKAHIKQWLKALLFALLTVVIVKAFFFWVYVIPSTSMEKTLLPGDLIFVNKMSYGIRLPITPITFPLSHQKMPLNNNYKAYMDFIEFPYIRLFSSQIERNDVVVFNYPIEKDIPVDHRSFYIKRCIGMPGDIISIKNKEVLINNETLPFPKEVCFNYHVKSAIKLNNDTLIKYGITDGGRLSGENYWQLTLSDSAKKALSKLNYIISIKPLNINEDFYADYIFPFHENYPWNIDFYGPLSIPKKGEVVALDTNNIFLYQKIIEDYEENELEQIGNQFIINGDTVNNYTFKMDYYFMMGDNRHNSSDSRFWGFVPENHIVGKAKTILISINKASNAVNKYRWERFFSGVE
jgi:signal peptidase I